MAAYGSSDENTISGEIVNRENGTYVVRLDERQRFSYGSRRYGFQKISVPEEEISGYRNGSCRVNLPKHWLKEFLRREVRKVKFLAQSREVDLMDVVVDSVDLEKLAQ